jgi:hypothetical protein
VVQPAARDQPDAFAQNAAENQPAAAVQNVAELFFLS